MARKRHRPEPTAYEFLKPPQTRCCACGGMMWVDYHNVRTVVTLDGLHRLTLTIRRCTNPACQLYHHPYRPEEEGAWALPHGEFGLDIIALAGRPPPSSHKRP